MSPILYRPLLACLLCLQLAACGTPTQSLTMALSPAEILQLRSWVPEGLKGQVGLDTVKGGESTGRWWGSKVSSTALEQALEDSLRGLGLLPMAPTPTPKYQLQVQLLLL